MSGGGQIYGLFKSIVVIKVLSLIIFFIGLVSYSNAQQREMDILKNRTTKKKSHTVAHEPSDTADVFANDKKLVSGDIIVDKKEVLKKIDSLKRLLKTANEYSLKSHILKGLGDQYVQINEYDSGINCVQQSLELLQKNNGAITAEIDRLRFLNYNTYITGNYLMSIQYSLQVLELSKRINDPNQSAFTLALIGCNYESLGDYRKAIDYLLQGKKALERYESGHWAIQNLAEVYLKMHKLDSALYYNQIAYHIADTGQHQQYMKDFAIRIFAFLYAERGDDELAFKYFRLFISDFFKYDLNNREIGHTYLGLAKLFLKNNQIDSSMFYAKRALTAAAKYNDPEYVFNASNFLYTLHDSLTNESEAFKYFKIAQAAKDGMASIEKIRQIQNLAYQEQVREKEQADADAKEAARIRRIIIIFAIIVFLISFLIWNRIRQLRLRYKAILEQKESEKLKAKYEKDLLELEAKALRAQMNPHFIFNCMNSIKALIQQHEEKKSIIYLTTFSKLIRTLFQNSDKRQISLHDEIETCQLYTQLEAMRFNEKLDYHFDIDPNIDLKSVMVPALIIQPFIENAIWHGIVPKDKGRINVSVKGIGEAIVCEIDDDGIGREMSKLNKPITQVIHESKGVRLSQTRLDIERMLNETQANIDIIDKYENIEPTGTKVVITFNLN